MPEDEICCNGVHGYFAPHRIQEADAFIDDNGASCLPCLYLKFALQGKGNQADKLLEDTQQFKPAESELEGLLWQG